MEDAEINDIAESIASLADMISEQFDRVTEQFDRIAEQFKQVNKRLDRLEERMDKVESRLDRLEIDMYEARVGQASMATDIKRIDGNTRATVSDVVEIYNRLTRLETGPATA